MSSATLALPRLNAALLASKPAALSRLIRGPRKKRPETILQFGEGGFLRGFVDWMIHRLHEAGLYEGGIVVVQPLPTGLIGALNEQDGLYTQILRGLQHGHMVEEREVVAPISRGIDPHTNFGAYLACAHNPDLRFIVSNTTEAGIACHPSDLPSDQPPRSFPAKLTRFLLERFNTFLGASDKGLVMLPCELIEYNGANLRRCVLETAAKWQLSPAFVRWVEQHNVFCNTLVDRIVTGYPRDEAAALTQSLGYEDKLLNTGEVFHSWVIEGPASLAAELPLTRAGLNVVWTDDYKPYRDRKVRILNGAHTMTVLAAYLAGKDTVKDCMDDPVISRFVARGLSEEIIPTLDLPRADLETFAAAVSERFSNPHVQHPLLSISLNSTSKFVARVLPSLKTYLTRQGTLPKRLSFSLAALIAFYRGTELREGALIGHRSRKEEYRVQDSPAVLEFFRTQWSAAAAPVPPVVQAVLGNSSIWGEDLNAIPGLTRAVTTYVEAIVTKGAAAVLRQLENE
ncbi:MAG TPA: tagaturonate reductase [Opitutaceae bacterium]